MRDRRANGSFFGYAMSAVQTESVSALIIGAPDRSGFGIQGARNGIGYIYRLDESTQRWTEEAALRPAHIQPQEVVGRSVALVASKFGLVAILGAPGFQLTPDTRQRGRAYVFTQEPATGVWTEAAALENCFSPSQTEGGLIGEGVAAVTTSTGVVVALGGRQIISVADFSRSSSGCIYSRDDTGAVPGAWTLQASLMPDPPDQNGGGVVGVSAGTDATGRATVAFGPFYGSYAMTYVREPGTTAWRQTNALYTSSSSLLGESSAQGTIAGQVILLAGAPFEQYFGSNAGAGVLYSRSPETSEYSLRAFLGSREDLNFRYLGFDTAVSPSGWVAASTSTRGGDSDTTGITYLYDVRSLFPVSAEAPPLPDGARLAIAGANPARGIAQVTYNLVEGGPVEIAVFDALGREVLRPVSAERGPGEHRETIPVSGLARGVYLVRLATAGRRESVRLVVER